jgi:hypothetical protein
MGKLIAAYGGGFKPPTKGHFEVVEKALNDFPEIDEFIIYVGGGERDGINQAQSILIWEIYQTYLPMKVKIEPSKAPIGDIIRLGKNNLQDEVYFIIGGREGREDDMKDIESRTKNIEEKYPNMKIKVTQTPDQGISGTNARQAAKVSYEDFIKFIPNELSDSEKEEVYNIVKPSIKEGLNENASYGKDIDVKGKIMQLTQHMLDKGYNIEPLPTVEFVDGDSDNARDFLGKTAYYNPENQTITLFTEGRHPKDIVRSFSHEMIHHIQYLEDRLGDITTTNTQEDDNLNNIEAEANLKGTMTFRNWTDSLNEGINEYDNSGPTTPKVYIVKDDGTYKEAPIELLSKISNLTYDMGGGETNYYPEKNIVIVDNIPVEEFAKEPGDIKGEKVYVEYNLNNPTSLPKANKIIASQLVYHLDNPKAFAQTISNSLKDEGTIDFFSDLMSKEDKIFLKYLSSEFGFGIPTTLSKYKNSIIKINKNKYKEIPESSIYKIIDDVGNVSKVSAIKKGSWWKYTKLDGNINFKSVEALDPEYFNLMSGISLSKASEETLDLFSQITHHNIVDVKKIDEPINEKKTKDPFGLNQYARELAQGLEEAIVGKKVECDNCDWSWNIKDGGDDLYTCHKCGHDNTPKQLNEGRYDKSTNQFSKIVFEFFKDVHDRGDKTGEFEFSVGPFEEDIYSEEFEFDLAGVVEITDDEYSVDGGANAGFDNKGDEITPLLSVKFKIPKNPDWQRVSFDIKDVVRHELEHLTQDGLNVKGGVVSDDPKLARPSKQMADDQLFRDMIDMDLLPKSDYFKLEKEVDAMLQGLYFKAKKSRRPFKDVIDDYLATQPLNTEEKEEILNVWRSRGKALSLPLFEQNKMVMNYEIYSDMDGVLTDFDASFMKASDGILPSEYEKNFGKDGFWELIDGKGVGFWVGMPWMSDGKTYWDYIKGYNPILLSSPSRSNTSRLGKRLWVKNNIPGTKLILAQAKDKQNYAQSDRILIDDRPSNIDQWRASGGIGILHTSASDTIRQLKDLGI